MNTVNITFSISKEVSEELCAAIAKRRMSRFVSEAIRKALSDEKKRKNLAQEYLDANTDEGQTEIFKDWESAMADGISEW